MDSFQMVFPASQPALRFIPYEPLKAVKMNDTVNFQISHSTKKASESHETSPIQIIKTSSMESPPPSLPQSQPVGQPVSGKKRDGPASDDEDPLCGLFSDDDDRGMPDVDTYFDSDETSRQRMCSPWAGKNSHEKSRTNTRATTVSADAIRNSLICTSFPDEHKGARQGHVSSGNRGWNDQMDAGTNDSILHETLDERTTLAMSLPSPPARHSSKDVESALRTINPHTPAEPGASEDTPIIITDDTLCLEDGTTTRGDSKVSLERMVKQEHGSEEDDAVPLIRASKRKREHASRLEGGEYNTIEVVDMTCTTNDTARKPKRPKRAIPPISPAEHHGTSRGSRPLNGSSLVWQYRGLIGYEVRDGKPFVRVAWHSTWEPADEFPLDEITLLNTFSEPVLLSTWRRLRECVRPSVSPGLGEKTEVIRCGQSKRRKGYGERPRRWTLKEETPTGYAQGAAVLRQRHSILRNKDAGEALIRKNPLLPHPRYQL
ncbi:hypothetical protein BDDG_09563 [Blastomyces dermatitidis ATCC 18188]|uniref:Chromo domain-containing protein n=1 Tax=Ajellomyces dermatitidis (strain ATCC 18188 / CBS 674.68) TaxID=653446 RepID=F2TTQ3_AJEDA|nr:hypothetical protein BDDG_09563 [Blastomyces dermatitidis ATCC 18188]